jgi:hypothetical protein
VTVEEWALIASAHPQDRRLDESRTGTNSLCAAALRETRQRTWRAQGDIHSLRKGSAVTANALLGLERENGQ